MNQNGSNNTAGNIEQDKLDYMKAWEEMMVTIWHDRLTRLKILDTTQLYTGIDGSLSGSGGFTAIMHKFAMYGIYQDCGTGRGYKRGNGGDLKFLSPENDNRKRRDHRQKSGKITHDAHRIPREWFSRAYYSSLKVLSEKMVEMTAEEVNAVIVDAIAQGETQRRFSMREVMWGSSSRRKK